MHKCNWSLDGNYRPIEPNWTKEWRMIDVRIGIITELVHAFICILFIVIWSGISRIGQLVWITSRQECFLNNCPECQSLLFQSKPAVCPHIYPCIAINCRKCLLLLLREMMQSLVTSFPRPLVGKMANPNGLVLDSFFFLSPFGSYVFAKLFSHLFELLSTKINALLFYDKK